MINKVNERSMFRLNYTHVVVYHMLLYNDLIVSYSPKIFPYAYCNRIFPEIIVLSVFTWSNLHDLRNKGRKD